MDKLLLTKETAVDMSINPSCFWTPERIEAVSKDWLTMEAELARLNTAIEGARETINSFYEEALDILNKHLGGKK
jgi:hypothetical protein